MKEVKYNLLNTTPFLPTDSTYSVTSIIMMKFYVYFDQLLSVYYIH